MTDPTPPPEPGDPRFASAFTTIDESDLHRIFDDQHYVAEPDIVTTVLLALRLGKPLLVEGEPGSGKTELGKVLAHGFDTPLIRLQCYEGLTAESTLYEWNYTKQLLAVQAGHAGVTQPDQNAPASVFSEDYLLERPLLQALTHDGPRPPVLLIDEVDRADEEFEALLLEILSDYQVTIPELGTITATTPPVVIITSNRTRGLSDALKRRCLYLHIEPPSFEKEQAIVHEKVPELHDHLAAELCAAVGRLREEPLRKQPGVAETLDWARAIATLRPTTNHADPLTPEEVETTLGCLLKEVEDVERVDDTVIEHVLDAAHHARPAETD